MIFSKEEDIQRKGDKEKHIDPKTKKYNKIKTKLEDTIKMYEQMMDNLDDLGETEII